MLVRLQFKPELVEHRQEPGFYVAPAGRGRDHFYFVGSGGMVAKVWHDAGTKNVISVPEDYIRSRSLTVETD